MRCKGALRAFARAFTAIITGDEGLFSGAQVGILLIDNYQSLQLAAHSSGRSGAIAIQNAQLVHEIEDKRRQPEVANKRREYLKVIRSSGPHLLVLINDMRPDQGRDGASAPGGMPSKISILAKVLDELRRISRTSPASPSAKRPGRRRSISKGLHNLTIIASTKITNANTPPSHSHGIIRTGKAAATMARRSHANANFSSREVGLMDDS